MYASSSRLGDCGEGQTCCIAMLRGEENRIKSHRPKKSYRRSYIKSQDPTLHFHVDHCIEATLRLKQDNYCGVWFAWLQPRDDPMGGVFCQDFTPMSDAEKRGACVVRHVYASFFHSGGYY